MERISPAILLMVLTAALGLCAGCPGDDDGHDGPIVSHQVFHAPVAVVSSDIMLMTDDPPRGGGVPVRLYAPVAEPSEYGAGGFAMVVLSPDTDSSGSEYAWLAKHLASQGYMCITIDHDRGRRSAASGLRRAREVSWVLDQFTRGRLPEMLEIKTDPDRVAVIGHGVGGYAALVAGGMSPDPNQPDVSRSDDRVDAVITLDAPQPGQLGLTAGSFSSMKRPALLVEPLRDSAEATEQRGGAGAFESLPAGLVFRLRVPVEQGDGFAAFTGSDRQGRSPIHHLWVGQVATAFLNATLRHERSALHWLLDERIEPFSRQTCRLERR